MYTLSMYTLRCTTSPPHTHYLRMALYDCYKIIYKREDNSLCLLVFSSLFFFIIVVVIYLWKEGSPPCCPMSATTTLGPYHILLRSMWVMLEKAKKKKKKEINGQTCLQYAYVCACVYKYTDTCVYKKGKRWVSKRIGHSVLTCTDMYYVCARTRSIKKINSTSLSQNLFSFIQIYLNPHTYFSINKHMLN